MTKMERAIAKLRTLPSERQEELAEYVAELAEESAPYRLTPEQIAEVKLARQELDEGKFASQQELDALWRRAGLIP
jgi:DNA-binding protein H-NS